jgi:hypothetical protein
MTSWHSFHKNDVEFLVRTEKRTKPERLEIQMSISLSPGGCRESVGWVKHKFWKGGPVISERMFAQSSGGVGDTAEAPVSEEIMGSTEELQF